MKDSVLIDADRMREFDEAVKELDGVSYEVENYKDKEWVKVEINFKYAWELIMIGRYMESKIMQNTI